MKHVVTLTTSNPAHEHVALRRKQSTTNFMVEAADEEQAILRATVHFRKLGHYIHEAKILKKKSLNEFVGVIARTAGAPLARAAGETVVEPAAAAASEVVSSALSRLYPKPLIAPVPAVPVVPKPYQVPVLPAAKPAVVEPETALEISPALKQAQAEVEALEAVSKTRPLTKVEMQRLTAAKTKIMVPTAIATKTAVEPKPAKRVPLPFGGFGLQTSPDVDIGTHGQWRKMFPLHKPFGSQEAALRAANFDQTIYEDMEKKKAVVRTLSRVMSARKTKDDLKGEKNKINMEPRLGQNTPHGAIK